jgi:Carboxypeptidase regulatory-like domain
MFLGAVLLAVSCGDGDKSPPPGPSPLLQVTLVRIEGPASVHPGNSAQFTAMLQLNDGTERAATSARWFSTLSPVLSINTNTGAASTRSDNWGETTLSVEVSLDGTGLTGQTRGSREILVLPDGTFRMVGRVMEADRPGQGVPDATLEVRLTEDLSSRPVAGASTNATGGYRLYGVPAESYLHVRRAGYVPVTERIQVGSHTARDFQLRFDGNVASFDGIYTMTVDATNCTGFTPPVAAEFRLRTYAATIRQSGARLTIGLSDAPFHPGSDGFSGSVTPIGANVQLRSFYDPYYYPSYPQQADVVELLPDGTALEASGAARLTGTPDRLSGTLVGNPLIGAIRRWQGPPRFQGPAFLGGCSAPRITLTRR